MWSKYLAADASSASSPIPFFFPNTAAERCGVTEKCALVCFPLPETTEDDGGMRDGTVTKTLQRRDRRILRNSSGVRLNRVGPDTTTVRPQR